MEYSKFKKYINKKHISIFDAQCRIIYYKFINMNKTGNQLGGGNSFSFIKRLKSNYLILLLESIYTNNELRINYIINNLKSKK